MGSLADIESIIALKRGDYERALQVVGRGLELVSSTSPDVVGYLINVRGLVYLAQSRVSEATRDFTETMDAAAGAHYARLEGFAAMNLAWALLISGDREGSLAAVTRARGRLAENRVLEAASARKLAAAFEATDPSRATDLLSAAVQGSLGNPDLYQPDPNDLPGLARNAIGTL